MFFKKKCEFCDQTVEDGITEKVEVYGRVGKWKKTFCSEECMEKYKEATAELMKNRKPRVCMRCLR